MRSGDQSSPMNRLQETLAEQLNELRQHIERTQRNSHTDTIGFTGTKNGMTLAQKQMVNFLIQRLAPSRVRHGVCIGADDDFHIICKNAGIFVVGHPGVNARGKCPARGVAKCDFICAEKPFIERNHDIVDNSWLLIGTPEGPERLRSGTWATLRFAKKQKKPYLIVWPDGIIDGIRGVVAEPSNLGADDDDDS